MPAVALSLAILAAGLLGSRAEAPVGDGRTVPSYGFDLQTSLVPVESLVAGGLPRDGLQALTAPALLSADDVASPHRHDKLLVPRDRVIGVELGGEARAYPLRLLRWHEVVNDTVGSRPIVVTYSPLCDSAMVAARTVAGEILEFGVSGLLHDSNLLMYDRRSDDRPPSLWSQIEARAVTGPAAAAGQRLEVLQADLAPWSEWRALHPETTVVAPVARLASLYDRDPYHSYFGSELLRFPVDLVPPAGDLALKDRIVAVTVNGDRSVFALSRLAAAASAVHGAWATEVGGLGLTIHFDSRIGAAWIDAPAGNHAVAAQHAFWFAWYAAFPATPSPGPPLTG